jgi:hypothetical protein
MVDILVGAGIAQWYSAGRRVGWLGFRVPIGAGNFSPHQRVQTSSGAHLTSYPMGIRVVSVEIKLPGREADRSPQSSAEVKIAWSYTSTPQ